MAEISTESQFGEGGLKTLKVWYKLFQRQGRRHSRSLAKNYHLTKLALFFESKRGPQFENRRRLRLRILVLLQNFDIWVFSTMKF